ncbi:MAG: DUF2330 domain-containing protein [Sandaracinaceae bacterium]
MRWTPAAAIGACILASAAQADASCFCMLRRPDPATNLADDIKNPATAVFLLRDGTHTVLTIEPAYEGPITELSMIVPLPTPIAREDVRTISGHHFRRVDRATAPRLRHTWDACPAWWGQPMRRAGRYGAGAAGIMSGDDLGGDDLGVEIEESWDVDEYDVSLLSAAESSGLLTFLRQRGLELPDRAAPILRSYIETGHRFALIEADPSRAQRIGDRMVLSPIQLFYDSEELRVPVRLGTLNSPGEQELLLYVLSRDGRFEVANREALVAPTDVLVRDDYEGGFPALYEAVLDRLYDEHPGATVTERATSLTNGVGLRNVYWFGLDRYVARNAEGHPSWRDLGRWTLSRIRYRYGADLDEDIVLRPAEPLTPDRRRRSNFTVTYRMEHHDAVCPSWRAQQAVARDAATSDEMWTSAEPPWLGDVIATEVLGVAPGAPRPVVEPPAPPAEVIAATDEEPSAPAPAPIPERSASMCAIAEGSRAGLEGLALLAALVLLAARRMRAARRPPRARSSLPASRAFAPRRRA